MIFLHFFSLLATTAAYLEWEDMSGQIQYEVMSHSFAAPFRYHSSFPNWYLSGSTVSTRDSRTGIILSPSILNRQGIMWNTQPLPTGELDATFMLHLDQGIPEQSERQTPPKDQKFGIWFSPTNISQAAEVVAKKASKSSPDWSTAFMAAGLDKSTGLPVRYGGVGFLLSPTDLTSGKRIPQITVISGSERTTVPLTPSEISAAQLMYLRLRLQVRKETVSVWFQERGEWRQIAKLPRKSSFNSGFLGITSYSGSTAGATPFKTRMSSLRVKSHDLMALQNVREVTSLFEKEGLTLGDLAEAPKDAIGQTKMIRKLIKVLTSYIGNTAPGFQTFREQVASLQHNVTELEAAIGKLATETKLTFKGSGQVSELAAQVQSIHSLLAQVEQEREVLLQSVDSAKKADTGDHVDRHLGFYKRQFGYRVGEIGWEIRDKGRFSFIMLLVVVAFAIIVGVAFYVRLNRYAQKAHLF